jgi:hypothetical protein
VGRPLRASPACSSPPAPDDQATSNTYSLIWALLSENENKAARELGIDLGKGRLYLPRVPGAKLEPVSSSAGAREGQRLTFGLLDETNNFLKANGGQRLARFAPTSARRTREREVDGDAFGAWEAPWIPLS